MSRRVLKFLLLFATGCASVALRVGEPTRPPPDRLTIPEAANARCVRAVPGAGNPFHETLPGPATDPELLPYLERLPPDVRRTAVAAGIESLLARVMRERERGLSLDLLAMRQELEARIASLGPQLLAMEFECECVTALLTRVTHTYDGDEADRQVALAIASLVTGAAFGLGAAIWDLANEYTERPAVPDGPLMTSIAGAVATTTIAASALTPRPREILIRHEHNVLTPIALGVDPEQLYPTFVFRMLAMPMPSGEATPRETLLASWSELIEEAAPNEERALVEALLFGPGGTYDRRITELRKQLFEELESMLDSLQRHIDLLARAVHHVLASARPEGVSEDPPPLHGGPL